VLPVLSGHLAWRGNFPPHIYNDTRKILWQNKLSYYKIKEALLTLSGCSVHDCAV